MNINKIIKFIARCRKLGGTYYATNIIEQLLKRSPTFKNRIDEGFERYNLIGQFHVGFKDVEIMDTFEFYYKTTLGDFVHGYYDRKNDLSIIFGSLKGEYNDVLLYHGPGFIPKFETKTEEAEFFRSKIQKHINS